MRTLIASLVAVLAFSACGGTEDTAAPVTKDEKYIHELETALPQFKDANEESLIDAGKGVCDYFEQFGVSLMTVGILTQEFEANFSREESATIFVVATTSYCPDIKDELLTLGRTTA